MVRIEVLSLSIPGIDDKRINRDFRPLGTLDSVPQQGAPEFASMVGESNGKAPQTRDGHRWIARQPFGAPDRHGREENPACGQCVEASNPICCNLAGHETCGGAASHILTGLLPKIAVERLHPASKLRTVMAVPKWLYDK